MGAGILHIRGAGGYFVVVENFNFIFTIPANQPISRYDISKNTNVHSTVIEAVIKWVKERLGIEVLDG